MVDSLVPLFADYMALCYHEARNVRHLARGSHASPDFYIRLINLPVNRCEAWRAIQPLRNKAKGAKSARVAEMTFADHFRITLEDLLVLFKNRGWKHAKAYGGNAWANITAVVIALANSIDQGDEEEARALLAKLSNSRHNNDFLRNKLRGLDANLKPS